MLTKQKEFNKEKIKLFKKLEISIAIQNFIPSIFDAGSISAHWEGNIFNPFTWVVTDGKGIKHTFTESEVPMEVYLTMPLERIAVLNDQHKLRKR